MGSVACCSLTYSIRSISSDNSHNSPASKPSLTNLLDHALLPWITIDLIASTQSQHGHWCMTTMTIVAWSSYYNVAWSLANGPSPKMSQRSEPDYHQNESITWEENNKRESKPLIDSYTKWAHGLCFGYSPLTSVIVSSNMRDFASQGLWVTLSRRQF